MTNTDMAVIGFYQPTDISVWLKSTVCGWVCDKKVYLYIVVYLLNNTDNTCTLSQLDRSADQWGDIGVI